MGGGSDIESYYKHDYGCVLSTSIDKYIYIFIHKYFTDQIQVKYSKTECIKERTQLYIEYIHPAFSEMVDKIVFTYKFTNLPNIDYLRDECKIWLMTILDKYDPNKGSKAFSYFSVITKNWFIHKVKQQQKRNKREIEIGNISKKYEEEYLSTNESYVSKSEEDEFWRTFYNSLKSWDVSQMKENDLKVYKAINILFESKEDIEIFNKKAIYLYIREITGLNTKQVVNNLNKLRVRYFITSFTIKFFFKCILEKFVFTFFKLYVFWNID